MVDLPTAGTKLLWIWTLGLCNIGHPEIAVGVIFSLIAKRGSQTSLKKSALLSSRALFSYHFKQITSSKSLQAKLVQQRAHCFRQG
jgi:hypothetical protein